VARDFCSSKKLTISAKNQAIVNKVLEIQKMPINPQNCKNRGD